MDLKISLDFLDELKKNNNREWFNDNRKYYESAKEEFESFIEFLIPVIKNIDKSIDVSGAKECLFRIFRDIRFSKNKQPYKTNFGAYIAKGGRKSMFAGYYVHMESGNSFAGGGIYMPDSKVLRAIRREIFENVVEYKKILGKAGFKKYFDGIWGEKLKKAPQGFPKDWSDIELIKNKHYAATHILKDNVWVSKKLIENLKDIYKAQFEFNSFLNRAVKRSEAIDF